MTPADTNVTTGLCLACFALGTISQGSLDRFIKGRVAKAAVRRQREVDEALGKLPTYEEYAAQMDTTISRMRATRDECQRDRKAAEERHAMEAMCGMPIGQQPSAPLKKDPDPAVQGVLYAIKPARKPVRMRRRKTTKEPEYTSGPSAYELEQSVPSSMHGMVDP